MSLQEPLDPKRPWITDPDDLPTAGNTLKAMLWPMGDTPIVPFRRVYLIFLLLSLPFVLMLLTASLGQGGALMPIGILGFFSIFLTIAHVRRLNHAGQPPFLAALLVVPAVLGFALFAFVAPPHVEEANRISAQIEVDKADPVAAAKRRAEARKKARESAGEASSGEQPRRRGGGPYGGKTAEEFDPIEYAVTKASAWPARIALISWIAVTLWSLLWVARLPKAGEVYREDLAALY